MKIVKIPFMENFKEAMLAGRKTMTCRSKAYGKIDDTFEIFGASFKLIAVYKTRLGVIPWHNYEKEGCDSPSKFIEVWNKLHPRKGYNPKTKVFVHEFVRIDK